MGTCGSEVQTVALRKRGAGVSVEVEVIDGVAVLVGNVGRVGVNVGKNLGTRDRVGVDEDKPGAQLQIKKTNKNIMIFNFFIILHLYFKLLPFLQTLVANLAVATASAASGFGM